VGYNITRQRDYNDGCLFVEIAVGGPKNAGPDILTARYAGEQKNLVDPRDAVNIAEQIFKRWDKDYGDETKRLRIVGLEQPLVFDFSTKGIAAAKAWADRVFATMAKCCYCGKAMGNRDPFTHDDLINVVFCSEACCATRYRDVFGIELPRIVSNKKKKVMAVKK
jgi:hypothetical protein